MYRLMLACSVSPQDSHCEQIAKLNPVKTKQCRSQHPCHESITLPLYTVLNVYSSLYPHWCSRPQIAG